GDYCFNQNRKDGGINYKLGNFFKPSLSLARTEFKKNTKL
ncbi:hypothetical protein, partial [uncultured Gammaproteobacteria bacterium]